MQPLSLYPLWLTCPKNSKMPSRVVLIYDTDALVCSSKSKSCTWKLNKIKCYNLKEIHGIIQFNSTNSKSSQVVDILAGESELFKLARGFLYVYLQIPKPIKVFVCYLTLKRKESVKMTSWTLLIFFSDYSKPKGALIMLT